MSHEEADGMLYVLLACCEERRLVSPCMLSTSARRVFNGRAANILERQLGVKTVGELLAYTELDLIECRNMGETTFNHVVKILSGLGLSLRP